MSRPGASVDHRLAHQDLGLPPILSPDPPATAAPHQSSRWLRLVPSPHLTSRALLSSAAALLCFPATSLAQEALRHSLAGEAAAEARRQQQLTPPSSLRAGDLRMLITPSLSVEYNDNVRVSSSSSNHDVILRPLVGIQAAYPFTEVNSLTLSVQIGYDHYFNNSELSSWRLQPGSELAFNFYLKDIWIKVHNRFQLVQDPSQNSEVADIADFRAFENTAGFLATWDLNDIVLNLGYDHYNYISSTSAYDYLDRASRLPVARAGFQVHPALTLGPEITGSFTSYERPVLNDSVGYSAGAYGQWQISEYLSVQPRTGYTQYFFDQTSTVIPAEDQSGWYAGLTIAHRINPMVSYNLSGGRELRLGGVNSDVTDSWYVRSAASWSVIRNTSLGTYLSYEFGKQPGSLVEDDYGWFSAGLSLGYRITERLTSSLSYRFTIRTSSEANRDYTQNVIGLQLSYRL